MNGFLFQSPWILTCLALLPLLGLLFRFAQKKRKELLAHLGGARHEPIEKKQNERTQNEWRTRAGIALLILALARPGAHPHPESSPEGGRDLIFLLDVSRSMLGTDFRPNRLERAKEDIVRCLDSLNHDRVGLMIFAGSSSLLSPLTTDDDFFKSRLKEVIPDSVAHGSTYLQIVLEKTTDLMISPDRHGYQDLILLTDGGDQGSHPEKTIAALNASKTRLMIVGYGDPKFGSRIPLGEKGSEGFLMDEGQEVWTRLEENSLKALAHANPEGIYLYAGKPGFDLGKAYQEWSLKAPRSSLNGTPKIVYDEYFAWLLLPALILLVPFGGRLPIKGSLLILLWVGMGSGVSLHGESASNEIETMQKSVTAELDPRLHGKKAFKLGLLLAKNNRFEEALKAFQDAEERAITPEKLARTLFNQAIVEAREAGSVPNPETKLALLETAIKKMKSALLLQPGWTTAAQGLEVFYEQQAGAQKALEDQNNKKKELDQDQQNLVKELKRLLEIQRTLVKVGTKLEHSKVIPPEQKIEQIKEQKPKQQDLQIQTTAAQDKIAFLQKAIREILNNPEKKTTPA
ncbi:MAG: VWA domain-containing protein, partial [Verrucomicrobiota bacterium]